MAIDVDGFNHCSKSDGNEQIEFKMYIWMGFLNGSWNWWNSQIDLANGSIQYLGLSVLTCKHGLIEFRGVTKVNDTVVTFHNPPSVTSTACLFRIFARKLIKREHSYFPRLFLLMLSNSHFSMVSLRYFVQRPPYPYPTMTFIVFHR